MKVGFVIDDTLDSTDGVQQYILLLGSWLQNQGHEVHYLTGYTVRRDIENIHSLSHNIRVSFNKNWLSIPLPAKRSDIKALLLAQNFDVLHIQMPYSPFLGGKIIKLAAPPTAIVGTFHIAPHSRLVTIASQLLGRLQPSADRINKIISVSPVAKDFALKTYKRSSRVIPNAVELSQWQPTVNARRDIDIVFLGRLVERKGCILLLQAVKQLHDSSRPSLRVVIAGDGPERNKLEQFVVNNKLQKIVSFKGYVSEQHKKELLQRAKVSAFPATGGESFGIVLIEAMAAGSLTIAGNNPGYNSVLGSIKSAMVSPRDTTAFSKRLAQALDDKAWRQRIIDKQQSLVKQYDIEAVGGAILKEYKAALKQGVK